jgi:hypothetical protein
MKRKHTKHREETVAFGERIITPSVKLGRFRQFVLLLIVFLWPFLYLFRLVASLNGQYTAIGNDFIVLYYRYKVYLLACLNSFDFPFWSPSEAAGYPFYLNPFAQAFYPLNPLLAIWYRISGGYNPIDHQVFTVLGLSIFGLGLFMWLRLLNGNIRAVLFSVLVMSVSFKMTEILRFPNAVHTAAWYPWILYTLTRIILSRSPRDAVTAGILLTIFVICFCTGGYPYYIYYGLFLFVPYMLVFLVKPLRVRLFGDIVIHWKRAFVTLMVAGFVSVLVCAPYLLGIKSLMERTIDRAGKSFEYSTQHTFTFEDTVGSLVYPPAAMGDGWNFFSITGILIVLLYLLSYRARAVDGEEAVDGRRRHPVPPYPHDLPVKLFFVIWIGLIVYITYGRGSYLFVLLWKYMPGFSSLRVWMRLNIILVPIFAWLLSIAYASFEAFISNRMEAGDRKGSGTLAAVAKVVAVYTAVVGIQLYFYLNDVFDPCWLLYFKNVLTQDIKFIYYGAVGFAAVLSLVIFGRRTQLKHPTLFLPVVVAALVLVAAVEMRPVGTRMWTADGKPWPWKERIHPDVAKFNKASFRFQRTDYDNSISLSPHFSVGVLENWYFDRYVRFLKKTEDELQARKIFLGVIDGRKLFFSESISHTTVKSFLNDAGRYQPAIRLLSYTGDELVLEIEAPADGFLSFIDNWDRGWKVFVDEKQADMELLFGTFKSVRLTPGRHHVRFAYQPAVLSFRPSAADNRKNGF